MIDKALILKATSRKTRGGSDIADLIMTTTAPSRYQYTGKRTLIPK
jgi:hypothetical protein